jgi:hypothetical protein
MEARMASLVVTTSERRPDDVTGPTATRALWRTDL